MFVFVHVLKNEEVFLIFLPKAYHEVTWCMNWILPMGRVGSRSRGLLELLTPYQWDLRHMIFGIEPRRVFIFFILAPSPPTPDWKILYWYPSSPSKKYFIHPWWGKDCEQVFRPARYLWRKTVNLFMAKRSSIISLENVEATIFI